MNKNTTCGKTPRESIAQCTGVRVFEWGGLWSPVCFLKNVLRIYFFIFIFGTKFLSGIIFV